jgi:hypothetical protein
MSVNVSARPKQWCALEKIALLDPFSLSKRVFETSSIERTQYKYERCITGTSCLVAAMGNFRIVQV